ncbi:STAS domain-containing protein [Leptolyngbya ohadii]|uniref:STAS domain-containing protein n=1 Tax=Leptolyngbya ohadii TaxID=1962290 RepID=UPI0019D489EA|nr:STAS domain-containing protein [Leptolyngbya ohadii]
MINQDVKVIQPNGILDATQADHLKDEVNHCLSAGAGCILIDFQDVTFMDSSGLAALISAVRLVRDQGKKLCLCSVNQQIKMLLELTSVDQIFQVFGNQEEFYAQAAD